MGYAGVLTYKMFSVAKIKNQGYKEIEDLVASKPRPLGPETQISRLPVQYSSIVQNSFEMCNVCWLKSIGHCFYASESKASALLTVFAGVYKLSIL